MNNEERNAEIVKLHEGGMSYREIAEKFGISNARAGQICKKHLKRQSQLGDDYYMAFYNAAKKLGRDEPLSCASRIYNCLVKHGITSLPSLAACRFEEIDGIRNIDVGSLEIVREVIESSACLVNIGCVNTFPGPKPDKEQAVKVIEEAAEVYSAWEDWSSTEDPELVEFIVDECADLITAACNLLAAFGERDMTGAMERCAERNRERGRM